MRGNFSILCSCPILWSPTPPFPSEISIKETIKHVFRAQLRGRGNIHEDPSFGMNENFAKGSTGCRWGVSFEFYKHSAYRLLLNSAVSFWLILCIRTLLPSNWSLYTTWSSQTWCTGYGGSLARGHGSQVCAGLCSRRTPDKNGTRLSEIAVWISFHIYKKV